jgi:short-chain fatty acids transporter
MRRIRRKSGATTSRMSARNQSSRLRPKTFIGSLIISLFVPSGGGHWAVQGPIAVDSALAMHQSSPAYLGLMSMAVAVGEGVANMIQPFWLLPLLAIAKLNVRQVMGFTIVAFVIGLVVLGATTLIAPYLI